MAKEQSGARPSEIKFVLPEEKRALLERMFAATFQGIALANPPVHEIADQIDAATAKSELWKDNILKSQGKDPNLLVAIPFEEISENIICCYHKVEVNYVIDGIKEPGSIYIIPVEVMDLYEIDILKIDTASPQSSIGKELIGKTAEMFAEPETPSGKMRIEIISHQKMHPTALPQKLKN